MKKIAFLLSFLGLFSCAQMKTGSDIAHHYPRQVIRPSINMECQKLAVEKNLGIEYSKWKTHFSKSCYPDQHCRQDFFDCLNSKGYRFQE